LKSYSFNALKQVHYFEIINERFNKYQTKTQPVLDLRYIVRLNTYEIEPGD